MKIIYPTHYIRKGKGICGFYFSQLLVDKQRAVSAVIKIFFDLRFKNRKLLLKMELVNACTKFSCINQNIYLQMFSVKAELHTYIKRNIKFSDVFFKYIKCKAILQTVFESLFISA